RQGLGAALVERALDKARGWGASRVEIGIIAAQDELREWYEKFGFELKGSREFDHLPFIVAFMGLNL
ncbi:MAG: GNAT family N-acetyltransferase, partial [Proteobacteria bacterium]|nr:GNAT family N-acetyltransferase [Pseudomonadota bacterium]